LTLAVTNDPGKEAQEPLTTAVTRVTKPVDAYLITELNVHASGTRSYYDPVTFQLLRKEAVDPTGTVVTVYGDYAQFGARTLAKHWTVSSAESHLEMHYERTEYVAGSVTAANVAEPSTQRTLVEFPAGVTQVDLPARTVRDAVYVTVQIGAKSFDFELDTGAGSIAIDPSVARDAGLTLSSGTCVVTAQRYTAYETKIPEMRIGSLRMHDIAVNVVPIPAGQGESVRPVGLLGFDFLAQLGVTIDYENELVRVVPADKYVPPSGPRTSAFPVRLGGNVPMLTMSVGKAVAERMILDTGCSCQLDFFDYFTRRYPDAFRDDVGQVKGYGVGGAVDGEMFRLRDVGLGPAHFQNLLGTRISGASYQYRADGLLGNQLLVFFTIGLDYTHGQIYLTPNAFGRRGTIH
jgi:predicted aspartyl protease